MRPDQLPLLTTVSAAAPHPSGEWAAVSAVRPDFAADAYVGQLWRVELDGRTSRRITRGFRDTNPRCSPDGRLIGFLRAVPEGRPQLMVVAAEGGEPQQVTDAPLGVSDFEFSPDSSQLAYLARVPEEGRYGTTEQVGSGQEDPRHITTLQFQLNGLGYTGDKRQHVFVVRVPDPSEEPVVVPRGREAKRLASGTVEERTAAADSLLPASRQVTDDDADYQSLAFTADGRSIIATASRHATRDTDLVTQLWSIDLTGGEPRLLTEAGPDGISVFEALPLPGGLFMLGATLGESGRDFVARNTGVYLQPAGGPREPHRLTDPDVEIETRLAPAGDDAVFAVAKHRGGSILLRVDAARAASELYRGDAVIDHVRSIAGRPIVSYHDDGTTGDIGTIEEGVLRPLTDFGARLRAEADVLPAQELTATSGDGYLVHGWAILPAGEGPHPTLLMIHGGPYAEYTAAFFDEAQVYATAGYAVVFCNPRGSASYGSAHGAAIRGDFGNLDRQDVLPSSTMRSRRCPDWTPPGWA